MKSITQFLESYEEINPLGSHVSFQTAWANDAREFWRMTFGEEEKEKEDTFEDILELRLATHTASCTQSFIPSIDSNISWEWLLHTTQIEQRTESWYNKTEFLTASEIEAVWKGPRTRGALIQSKVAPGSLGPNTRTAVSRAETNAFDWGIRYEPLVKKLLEEKHSIVIQDLGRIMHPSYSRLGASPDGLITSAPNNSSLLGSLIEIKCPKSRVIDDSIPRGYWMQMQIQMQVCNRPSCEYVEVKFEEGCPDEEAKGFITLVSNPQIQEFQYIYSSDKTPTIDPSFLVHETYGWKVALFRQITVGKDDMWFESIQNDLELFWKDVELAKQGLWTMPPKKEKKEKEKKNIPCAIVDD